MPDGGSLQIHLFPVAEGIAAFRATRARRMEMMVVASLQDLTTDVAVAVGAFYSELLLVILLAVRHAVPVEKENVTANCTRFIVYSFVSFRGGIR